MDIVLIESYKKRFLDLLLIGDEQESMIDMYLERGDMFALYDNGLKAVCVVTKEGGDIYEIKNISVYPQFHRRGYGKQLVEYVSGYYDDCRVMILGTGDTPEILSFYKSCGFEYSHRIANFFTNNYNHPIYENGVLLEDMVYLKKYCKNK